MPRGAVVVDITGQRFGRLLVLSHEGKSASGKHMWLCRCDCGTVKSFVGMNLRRGDTNSCGCLHREQIAANGRQRADDLHGERFWMLTVVSRSSTDRRKWECICECGGSKVITASSLRGGLTRSCGCMAASRPNFRLEVEAYLRHLEAEEATMRANSENVTIMLNMMASERPAPIETPRLPVPWWLQQKDAA